MKKYFRTVLTALCLTFLLCSCEGGGDTDLKLYFPAEAQPDGLYAEAMDSENYYGDASWNALLESLLMGPTQVGMRPICDSAVKIIDWKIEEGVLRIELSEEYRQLAGIDRSLADCCIARTLCQLDEVKEVMVVSGSEEGRILSEERMLFTGTEQQIQVSVELYFPRSAGRGLGVEVRELTITEDESLVTAVAQALVNGPENNTLRGLFPEGSEVLGTRVDDGVCYVYFSAALVEQAPEDLSEQDLLLYSIVDTLGNLDAVEAVQVLVEGEQLSRYGNTDTTLPLEPDFSLTAQ